MKRHTNGLSLKFSTLCFLINMFVTLDVIFAQGTLNNSSPFDSFESYIQKFNKNYSCQKEYKKREKLYNQNIKRCQDQSKGQCQADNQTDWTFQEIALQKKNSYFSKLQQFALLKQNLLFKSQSRILTDAIPVTFDWRNHTNMTEVKHQGQCGASDVFSTVAFFQQELIMAGEANSSIDLSETYLIHCNSQNQICSSGRIQSSIDKVFDKGGIPLESKYPFHPNVSPDEGICFETDFVKVLNHSRISYFSVNDPQKIQGEILKKPIIAGVCGIDFTSYQPSTQNSTLRTLRCKPENRIVDHSVLLIGYTETQWIVKNHWGKSWGYDGYGFISRNQAQDCCIGQQLHTTGNKTQVCTVQNCDICVENVRCSKCHPGLYVKQNTTSESQTCQPCLWQNCLECHNYLGTCKQCDNGFAINKDSGKCEASSIAHCSKFSFSQCLKCKHGYQFDEDVQACAPFCKVKNCYNCSTDECTQCKAGFGLASEVINGSNVQFCYLHPCSVENCNYCNSSGSCVQCRGTYILAQTGLCKATCSVFANCVSCTISSCRECANGTSLSYYEEKCEVFNNTQNCMVHVDSYCYVCRQGYEKNLNNEKCMQLCSESSCVKCLENDISHCLTCTEGYFLDKIVVNNITYSSLCAKNPCLIANCSLCDASGDCFQCQSSYKVYNKTSGVCQNQCNITNCQQCLPDSNTCNLCDQGFIFDQGNLTCIVINIPYCILARFFYDEYICRKCQTGYQLNYYTIQCKIYCSTSNCEICQVSTPYQCEKCSNGFNLQLLNGALSCVYIQPIMEGCDLISFNQSYCFSCNYFYVRNTELGTCQANTTCPMGCEFCGYDEYGSFVCKCSGTGTAFNLQTGQCMASPINDSMCIEFFYWFETQAICVTCMPGTMNDYFAGHCVDFCQIQNCKICDYDLWDQCNQCIDGYYPYSQPYAPSICIKCPFNNCKTCTAGQRCEQCVFGFSLDVTGQFCTQLMCADEFYDNGYECVCYPGTYIDGSHCYSCPQSNCLQCNQNKCFSCMIGFYITASSTCQQCPLNCKICNSYEKCEVCQDSFLFDESINQCASISQMGGSFFVGESFVVKCPSNCLQCNEKGYCTQCLPGYTKSGEFCLSCQNGCRQCYSSDTSACISCQDGYYRDSTSCLQCIDTNCSKCSSSGNACSKCREGFYLQGVNCLRCGGENCLACNDLGDCTQCQAGFALMDDFKCQQCAGNCKMCDSSSINQCLTACNSSQYKSFNDAQCHNCPQNCQACLSAQLCSSCKDTYILRGGICIKECAQSACYKCDQSNPEVCQMCIKGYRLTEFGTCDGDIACNQNKSCTFCPSMWTLINGTCEICNVDEKCLQCSKGQSDKCILCKEGFYLLSSNCVECHTNCQQCSEEKRCQTCKDGFYLEKEQIFGYCQPCFETCKTCMERSEKCTSCKMGFKLSVTQKCLRSEQIDCEIELDLALQNFVTFSREIRKSIVSLLGSQYQNQTKNYIITELKEGSVLLSFSLTIPQNLDSALALETFQYNINAKTQIGGVPLISVAKIGLIKANANQSVDPDSNKIDIFQNNDQSSKRNLAIILGIVIPCGVIIIGVVWFFVRRKCIQISTNTVTNLANETVKQSIEHVTVNMKSKLKPINYDHSKYTSLKNTENQQFGSPLKRDTFLGQSDLSHQQLQQSYEQFYQTNEFNAVAHGPNPNLKEAEPSCQMELDPSHNQQQILHKEGEKNMTPSVVGKIEIVDLSDDTIRQFKQQNEGNA